MFDDIYRGKRVLVTGHSGFKGSWLTLFLETLGAEVLGVALPPETRPNHFACLALGCRSEWRDLRDAGAVRRSIVEFRPEIVFHLAAQPLVRRSYREPAATFAVNVMGTINLLDGCRACESVRAVVAVTSDKCYENRERPEGYRETDPMGGFDPYSASKGCAELAIACYRRSFFSGGRLLPASARAGNVIGGGDWAEDRLVPDLVRAAAAGEVAELRNPGSIRPFQHVLDPLSGYLALGAKLLKGEREFAEAWNFGPPEEESLSVEAAAKLLAAAWPAFRFRCRPPKKDAPHEAEVLRLDSGKARGRLGWRPVWSAAEAFRRTAEWYRAFHEEGRTTSREVLAEYCAEAARKELEWTK